MNIHRLNLRDCWNITSTRLIEMAQKGLPNMLELIVNSGINDESLAALGANCANLMHLDISFEEYTYNDETGCNLLTDKGFVAIAQFTNLRLLRLRHVGRLNDYSLGQITAATPKLSELTLNLRHRHKLTDIRALERLPQHCPNLKYFEAVHNHFVGKYSLGYLAGLATSLKHLILRGDELVTDESAAELIHKCPNLRTVTLDGCIAVNQKTLTECIIHAQNIPMELDCSQDLFHASLVCTAVDRTALDELASKLPSNLRIRVSDQQRNKAHYNEWNGTKVNDLNLRDTFFPFYWHDYN